MAVYCRDRSSASAERMERWSMEKVKSQAAMDSADQWDKNGKKVDMARRARSCVRGQPDLHQNQVDAALHSERSPTQSQAIKQALCFHP